jgi:hypothetical protein
LVLEGEEDVKGNEERTFDLFECRPREVVSSFEVSEDCVCPYSRSAERR